MIQPSFVTATAELGSSVVSHSQTLGSVDVQVVYERWPHLKASSS